MDRREAGVIEQRDGQPGLLSPQRMQREEYRSDRVRSRGGDLCLSLGSPELDP